MTKENPKKTQKQKNKKNKETKTTPKKAKQTKQKLKKGKKLLFFDIDGTIVDFNTKMPESTKTALHQAKENGHKIFLNTGRSEGTIYDFLKTFGFDGTVAAAGLYVECEGKVIHQGAFTPEQVKLIVEALEDADAAYMVQTDSRLIASPRSVERYKDLVTETRLPDPENPGKLKVCKTALMEILPPITVDSDIKNFHNNYKNVQNVCYALSQATIQQLNEILGPYQIKICGASYKKPDEFSGEITPSNTSKSASIQTVIDYYNADPQDIISFGDAPNDLEMIEFSHIGVAMGNAADEVKAVADYITTRIDDDGIYNALKHFEII